MPQNWSFNNNVFLCLQKLLRCYCNLICSLAPTVWGRNDWPTIFCIEIKIIRFPIHYLRVLWSISRRWQSTDNQYCCASCYLLHVEIYISLLWKQRTIGFEIISSDYNYFCCNSYPLSWRNLFLFHLWELFCPNIIYWPKVSKFSAVCCMCTFHFLRSVQNSAQQCQTFPL